jgi:hypothetical protein
MAVQLDVRARRGESLDCCVRGSREVAAQVVTVRIERAAAVPDKERHGCELRVVERLLTRGELEIEQGVGGVRREPP